MRHRVFYWLSILIFAVTTPAISQNGSENSHIYGDRKYRRSGIHNGNLVATLFYNHGEVAHWKLMPSGEWPKGSGHSYMDGIAPLVAAEVEDIHGRTIHILEIAYRERMDNDIDPVTGVEWGWQPLPGYFNEDLPLKDQRIAMSDQPETWPYHWPDKDDSWNGKWNGYFGQKTNADQESYFVMDDACDKEFEFFPDAHDSLRGGLGLRVAVRGFQWSHVLAEDVIFWHYDITNIGTHDYEKIIFGMYVDCGVGGYGDSLDDWAFFDTKTDITYSWDDDNIGEPGHWSPVGYCGYAFLESPGNPYNGIDDDEDGIIDERRDSGPGVFLDTYPYGIDNVEAFVRTFKREPRPHWSGDEDCDWDPFTDLNGNGIWDGPESGEPLNDDVGKDGLGPLDRDYPGPDEGEGDGIPTDGEPDFDKTDKDESDQIGLTAFDVSDVEDVRLDDDEGVWNRISYGHFDTGLQNANIGFFYGSGPFILKAGETQRFSLALLFGEDKEDIFRNKETVQLIYNANYNFARPPDKPTVRAVIGDRRVTLYWDRVAEKSRDAFLNYREDFEGYLIYRSTDPQFNEVKIITDSYGNKTFRKPIAQFDIIDGIVGPDPVGVHGARFNRGEDTGLKHAWTDTTVENGQTYYYAVVSYDQGDPEIGLAPSECTSIIEKDVWGNFRTDINTVAVTPNAPAAGYTPPEVKELSHVAGPGTGYIELEILDPLAIKNGHRYQIVFEDTSMLHQTASYSVYDVTSTPKIQLVNNCSYIQLGENGEPQE
ncbi:MAG: hypothetical protein DRG83_10770, partial [Deltaproteobacteria bacterium]